MYKFWKIGTFGILLVLGTATLIFSKASTLSALDPQASPTPQPTPTFSCCEHDIKVNQVKVDPQKTTQGAGTITVTINFELDISWRCNKVESQDCLAFYNVTLESSSWEKLVGKNWVAIPNGDIVTESVIPDPPLKVKCDGQNHKGTWSYTYIATIKAAGKIRNTGLVFDWDIPQMKGRSYHAEYQIEGVSSTTGTKPPTVTGSHPKQK